MSISRNRSIKLAATTACGAMALALAAPVQAIVPNDNFTPTDIIDETGANGVGMFFRNDGFVCSGTLINPRTVLFAAHCVNDRPESDYGTIIRSAFSFDDNALPGFISWINNGFSTFSDQFVYDIAQIQYNPESLTDPNAFGFLEADIALATLADPVTSEFDPATNSLRSTIPMWALLFSPLPTPTAIDPVDGTGYHVNITGYGRSGSGTTGASQGIDWRRRAAENMLGALTSFDERNQFLFGNPFGNLPQSLYRLDFDDPNKTNPFDFNLYKDEPRTVEGTTAGGDSGGPLILDAANNNLSTENLQIGVLSGGSRFFGPQVFSSYGTESFYQPLYLFWDYIVASNPYRYVSAVAGDGAWEDPTHWISDLDPIYRVIDPTGAVVNGLPTSPGAGRIGGSPDFGEVCFDPEGNNPGDECQDLNTGDPTPPARNVAGGNTNSGVGNVVSGIGRADIDGTVLANGGELTVDGPATVDSAVTEAPVAAPAASVALAENEAQAVTPAPQAAPESAPGARAGMIMGAEHQAQSNGVEFAIQAPQNGVDFAIDTPQNGVDLAENEAQDGDTEEGPQGIGGGEPEFAAGPNPAPTIDNGLPGATGFVPNNVNADVANGVNGRFFDVTLSQGGTTTLGSTVTIDRLTVTGVAGLNIGAAGDLTSLIDITQTGGMINVDGTLLTNGDYLMVTGLLSGSGTVQTPFLTNVAGAIAPGTMGGAGTLNVNGNLILSSGSTLLFDLGAGAALPRNGTSDRITVTGQAAVDGNIAFAAIPGTAPQIGDQYLLLTADGGVTGTFNGSTGISAILFPVITYGPNAVRAWISANQYRDVIDRTVPLQISYADLLDDGRGSSGLADIFAVLDYVPTGAEIGAILNSWAPTTEATVRALGASTLTHLSDFHNNRLVLADRSTNGGTLAVIGSPVQTAALANGGLGGTQVMSDLAIAGASATTQGGIRTAADINEDLAIYIAGGFINGQSNPMRTVQNFRDDDFDGYFLAGGIEYYVGENAVIGGSIYYSDLDANAALGNSAENDTIVGTIYGRAEFGRFGIDGQFSFGNFSADTTRRVSLGAATQTLVSSDDSRMIAAEGGIDYALPFVGSTTINPGIGLRYHNIDFGPITETGGSLALNINRRDYHSFQGTAGLEVVTKPNEPFEARLSALFVHDFNRQPATFQGNFAAGNVFSAPFALGGRDRDWVELSAGLRLNRGNVSFDLAAHTTVERNSVDSQAFTAGVSFRF